MAKIVLDTLILDALPAAEGVIYNTVCRVCDVEKQPRPAVLAYRAAVATLLVKGTIYINGMNGYGPMYHKTQLLPREKHANG